MKALTCLKVVALIGVSALVLAACGGGGGGGGGNAGGDSGTQQTITYSISGSVSGVAGTATITVTGAAGSKTTSTAADGTYSVSGFSNGAYTVTPSKANYVFTPLNRSVTIAGSNASNINFTGTPGISYTLSGSISMSIGGALPNATVTLSGSNSGSATTDASGNFSFPVSNGTYTLTPSLAGWNFSPTSISRTINGADSTGNNFTATSAVPGYTVSGTVSYAGSKTGKIYVGLVYSPGGSTSGQGTVLATAGTYTIRGVQSGNYKVYAFMDTTTTHMAYDGNPSGQSGAFSVSNGNATANVTMTDSTATPSVPQNPVAMPMNNGVAFTWDTIRGSCPNWCTGATGYNIYYSTAPGGPFALLASIPEYDSGIYMHTGLTNNDVYYYKVSSLRGAAESAQSAVAGPVTVGTPAGGVNVSGTVTFPGSGTGHNMYVLVYSDSGAYFTTITNPSSPQNYTIPGVQPGTYEVFGFVDLDNDGTVNDSDLGPGWDQNPQITVGGSNYTGANIVFNAQAGTTATIRTVHTAGSSEYYQLIQTITRGQKLPVKATVMSGPNIPLPSDLANLNLEGIQIWSWFGSTVPAVGDAYIYDVTYSDGTTERLTASVTAVIPTSAMATAANPANGAVNISTLPTFTWTAPPSPLPSYTYRVGVFTTGGGWLWGYPDGQFTGMPSSQTSVKYNVNGWANLSVLNGNSQYSWEISVLDSNGNMGRKQANFTTGSGLITVTGTMVDGSGAGIPNAQVGVYENISSSPTYSTMTNSSGTFTITAPAYKDFVIGYGAAGYAPKMTRILNAGAGFTATLRANSEASMLTYIQKMGQCLTAVAYNDPCIQGKAWMTINTVVGSGTSTPDATGVTASTSPAGPVIVYNDGTTGAFTGSATVVRTVSNIGPQIFGYSTVEGVYTMTLTQGLVTKSGGIYLKPGLITGWTANGFDP